MSLRKRERVQFSGTGPSQISREFPRSIPTKALNQLKKKTSPTYSQVFGEWLCDMASVDTKLVALTPAMREGSGLVKFEQLYPDRYFDVAIAEQHCVNVAAGMACEGLKPVVAIYSTFLQRAFDQLVHDVVNQSLPVLFAVDRAGCCRGRWTNS